MRYHDFLDEFAKVAHEFTITKRGMIRAKGKGRRTFCPITKVAVEKGQPYLGPSYAGDMAGELKIDMVLAQELVDSSDNITKSDYWNIERRSHFSARTRRDLEQLIEKMKMIRGKK